MTKNLHQINDPFNDIAHFITHSNSYLSSYGSTPRPVRSRDKASEMSRKRENSVHLLYCVLKSRKR